jgi:hypothetical protein
VNRLLPSPAMVVACTSLVIALGGTGYAAAKINGKSLKNRSVASSKLMRDSVGGTEIRENTLQTVPRAASAGQAEHAALADAAARAENAGHADSAATAADLPDLSFENLTLENGWTTYPDTRPPAAALDAQGIVHLRGGMSDGSSPIVFTLPPRLRPSSDVYIPVDLVNGHPGRLSIQDDGTAYVVAAGLWTDAKAFTSLEGVTFDAGD